MRDFVDADPNNFSGLGLDLMIGGLDPDPTNGLFGIGMNTCFC